MATSAIICQNKYDVAIEDVDELPVEHPIQLVIDITTGSAIRPNETRCESVWSELNVR